MTNKLFYRESIGKRKYIKKPPKIPKYILIQIGSDEPMTVVQVVSKFSPECAEPYDTKNKLYQTLKRANQSGERLVTFMGLVFELKVNNV